MIAGGNMKVAGIIILVEDDSRLYDSILLCIYYKHTLNSTS